MGKETVVAICLCLVGCLLGGVWPVGAQSRSLRGQDNVVHALWFSQGQERCNGGTSPVYLRLERNPLDYIQVGFFESSAGAVGEMWRTAGWMAALVSTTLLGQDLHTHRISYTVEGLIDGPSAGALMTSGLLALMRGDRLLDHTTMTGTINPDGTIGPVGGIAFKLQGAKQAGKTRVAIPRGKSRDLNMCTRNEEDVIAIGRRLGVEVVEVGDIREAYAFLTGSPLPTAPVKPVSFDIPPDIRTAFRQLTERWLTRYEAARRIVAEAREAEFPPQFQSFWQIGAKFARQAQDELASGHEPAAFNRMWTAVLNAEFVARGVSAMRVLLSHGLPGLHTMVQREIAQVQQRVEANQQSLQGLSASTIADAGALTLIGAHLATALAFLKQAEVGLRHSRETSRSTKPKDPADAVLSAFEALGHLSVSAALTDVAVATKGWLGRGGPALPTSHTAITSALGLYRAAARSNLAYVDALIIAREAKRKQIAVATAQQQRRRHDALYLSASGALEQSEELPPIFASKRFATLAEFGALIRTVSHSSLLVAKHYSLHAQTDELGRVVGFASEAPLLRMTELAEREALRALGEAEAATNGASTPMLVAFLDAARQHRDVSVTPEDRLTALALFWDATLTARFMTQLAQQH